MPTVPSIVRNLSDTALWAASFRAYETRRPDALFRDPLATRLAGTRGFEIAAALSTDSNRISWVTRTYLFDAFLEREIAEGVDLVVSLGAGLDARPYRMPMPSSLRWVEVDVPEIIEYKQNLLVGEKCGCEVQRIGLDLGDFDATRAILQQLDRSAKKILVFTEGVLIYLTREKVAALACELATHRNFKTWILEMVSPEVLQNMQRTAGAAIGEAGATFQFGPIEGPDFFKAYGWNPREVRGVLKTAVQLGRTPIDPQLSHLIPDSADSGLPWVGVCVLESQESASVPPI